MTAGSKWVGSMAINFEQGGTEKPSGNESVGRIVSVTGSRGIVLLDQSKVLKVTARPEMGTLLKIDTPNSHVLGLVSAMSIPVPSQVQTESEVWIAEVEFVGELQKNEAGEVTTFRRGVSVYPSLADPVYIAGREDLEIAYSWDSENAVTIGTIYQDRSIPATVRVDELLGKHFAVLGTTGTGKSCAVALILQAILRKNREAHILLIDPHSEYSASFRSMAEIVSPSDLHLPYWFLTFDEIVEVLVGDRSGKDPVVEILADLIPIAKANYGSNRTRKTKLGFKNRAVDGVGYSVDSPTPYRISDLLALIDERMGTLEHQKNIWPLKQLKQRIEAVSKDQRYAFMFGSLTVQDHMSDVLGRLFRIPVDSKPITILQLTGLPSEVVNVVVSVLCRMTFDFGLWSDGMIPVTLVCEEAHRYIPTDAKLGFEPTRRAIARIAKEGRKYGVSLCIVSQRPSELDPTILSQCNTVFAMRMCNERDQQIVTAAVSDTAASMLEFLPSLATREAIAFGDGVTLPVRICFDELAEKDMPKGRTAQFTEKWRQQIGNREFLDAVVEKWRAGGSPFGYDSNKLNKDDELMDLPVEGSTEEIDPRDFFREARQKLTTLT